MKLASVFTLPEVGNRPDSYQAPWTQIGNRSSDEMDSSHNLPGILVPKL